MVTGDPARPGRRAVLAGAVGLALAGSGMVRAASGQRLAAIDWAMAETAMALGHPPAAIAELIAFRREAPQAPPAATADLGLRGSPNLEALSLAAPNLILSSNYYAFIEPRLAGIAPVFSRAIYVPGEAPFPKVIALLDDLGHALGVPDAALSVRHAAEGELARLAARAAPHAARPCLLMQIGDARHVRIFGADSLFGGALQGIGLTNGWTEDTRFAFNAPVPMERLAECADARFIIVGDVPPQAARALRRGALWNSLDAVRGGRVHVLPEINAFGGLPSGLRFASALVGSLEDTA